jgi:hypothetical protein
LCGLRQKRERTLNDYFDALSMTCATTEIRAATAATSARTDCMWRSEPSTSRLLGRLRSKATRRASALEMNPARTEIHEAAFLLMTFPAGVKTNRSTSIDGIDFPKLSLFSTKCRRSILSLAMLATSAEHFRVSDQCKANVSTVCYARSKPSWTTYIIFLYLKAQDKMPFPINCFSIGRRDAVHPSLNLQPANAVMQSTRRLLQIRGSPAQDQ